MCARDEFGYRPDGRDDGENGGIVKNDSLFALQRGPDRVLSIYDAAKELMGAFNPFAVAVLDDGEPIARVRYARLGPMVIGDVTPSATIRVRPVDRRHGYQLLLPLHGHLESRHLGADLVTTPGTATIYRAEGNAAITRWSAKARVIIVHFDQYEVHRALESQVGAQVSGQIPFSMVVDQSSRRGRSLMRMLLMLNAQLNSDDSLILNPLVALPYAESLIRGLLVAADHPYRRMIDRQDEPGRPIAVRTAVDLMESEPGRPLTTSVLAAEAHVSVRTLQEGFRRHLGVSPMAYLRRVRLYRAYQDLLAADPSTTTVTAIAHRWGFTHLGRFAAAYQAVHGEAPATTLRAVR